MKRLRDLKPKRMASYQEKMYLASKGWFSCPTYYGRCWHMAGTDITKDHKFKPITTDDALWACHEFHEALSWRP